MINNEGFLSAIGSLAKMLVNAVIGDDRTNKISNRIADLADSKTLSTSLTQGLKNSVITSRAFIDETLMSDSDMVTECLNYSHILYTNLVTMSLQYNQIIEKGRVVGDLLKPVSTEDNKIYIPLSDQIEFSLEGKTPSTENDYGKTSFGNVRDVEQAPPNSLPLGKLISYTLTIPQANGSPIQTQVTLVVRVNPYYINNDLLKKILSEKSNLTWTKRFIQWRMGEISFWKDLILGRDIIRESEDTLRKDSSGGYHEYLSMIKKKTTTISQKFLNAIDILFGNKNRAETSSNVANSIFIVSEDTLHDVKTQSGIDLYNTATRNKFFRMSYVMLLIVVDQNYGNVRIMINGFDEVATYPYNQFKQKVKNSGGDITNFLKQIAMAKF